MRDRANIALFVWYPLGEDNAISGQDNDDERTVNTVFGVNFARDEVESDRSLSE
jgi:hypothetical protein